MGFDLEKTYCIRCYGNPDFVVKYFVVEEDADEYLESFNRVVYNCYKLEEWVLYDAEDATKPVFRLREQIVLN